MPWELAKLGKRDRSRSPGGLRRPPPEGAITLRPIGIYSDERLEKRGPSSKMPSREEALTRQGLLFPAARARAPFPWRNQPGRSGSPSLLPSTGAESTSRKSVLKTLEPSTGPPAQTGLVPEATPAPVSGALKLRVPRHDAAIPAAWRNRVPVSGGRRRSGQEPAGAKIRGPGKACRVPPVEAEKTPGSA